MSNPQLTAASFLSRSIEDEQRRFVQEAERLAEQAARIAANLPGSGHSTVSGDLTRLIAEATSLLKRCRHHRSRTRSRRADGRRNRHHHDHGELLMSGIYDDGATYGPNPDAQPSQDTPNNPIYDDGAQYGPTAEQ